MRIHVYVQYLRVPLKRQAINKPGTPDSDPKTCITKYGRICKKQWATKMYSLLLIKEGSF